VERTILFLASGAYVGYVPVASGTFGSLLALPLLVALAGTTWPPAVVGVVLVALIAIAVPICHRAGAAWGQVDSSYIVLDEICGMAVAGALLPANWWTLALAFLVFRIFDIVKPYPAGHFDRHVKNGFGVVADDVVAGVYANLVVRMLT
jgi:phosphatidylglycerophosphatase A